MDTTDYSKAGKWPLCDQCDFKFPNNEKLRKANVRIAELEQRIEHLRVSRRVLMSLLESVDRDKKALEGQLENALRKLKGKPIVKQESNPFEVVIDNTNKDKDLINRIANDAISTKELQDIDARYDEL
jgi:hypothetical protein